MGPSLLAWGFFTTILVSGCLTELCERPPELKNAVIRVLAYKVGTILTCECERGFHRVSSRPFMLCAGNASHSAWDRECQCVRTSSGSRGRVTQTPDRNEERRNTAGPGQTQPGHCTEPPPWEHEGSRRMYHFVVGQELYYQCTQGEPARSVCEVSCGKTRWTQPRLTCSSEGALGPFPEIPKNETPCPPLTAGVTTRTAEPAEPPAYTEESETSERPLPAEYMITVTCCMLLLVGILLLSGLTWQHRWRKMRRTL